MRILFVSHDFSGADLAYRLQEEGNEVKVFVHDHAHRHAYEGMLNQVDDWRDELTWVGLSDGLIVFDSIGYGETQDELRAQGYSVMGGCAMGDRLEHDRQYGQKIMSVSGIEIVPSVNFDDVEVAIEFLEKNKGFWVIKQNGHIEKTFNYVGRMESSDDVVTILKNYGKNDKADCHSIDLQRKVRAGVEIGIARYFNGHDWVGPIEINLEHKGLYNGNLGPKTYEMGTLMWYDDNENNRLFQETLAKLKPALAKGNFRGDVDVNCIINEDGIFPLELTARFGFPAVQLQVELHQSPWGEFLKAVADGQSYDLKYKKEYGIVVLVAVPPFPYDVHTRKYSALGLDVNFKKEFAEEDFDHIHFEEVSLRKNGCLRDYYVSGKSGFVMHVTGSGKTIKEARVKTYDLVKKIIIPKIFYRTDIGMQFLEEDQDKLRIWGWL